MSCKEIPKFSFAVKNGLDQSFVPNKSDDSATGWDVRSADIDGLSENEGVTLEHGEMKMISLGFKVFAPEGWWLEIRPRSSSFVKKHLHSLYGVVDENYEGYVRFAARYLGPDKIFIPFGERIGQIIPVRRQKMEVASVSNEEYDKMCSERAGTRGSGGFGSTGNK